MLIVMAPHIKWVLFCWLMLLGLRQTLYLAVCYMGKSNFNSSIYSIVRNGNNFRTSSSAFNLSVFYTVRTLLFNGVRVVFLELKDG